MRRILGISIRIPAWVLIIMLIIFSDCEKEKITTREYPRLKTLDVDHIDENGAMFHAEITYRGDFEITHYGFVWSSATDPNLENSDKIVNSNNLEEKSFSASITTTLLKNQTYRVRSFLETAEYIVYGDMVEFISLGSQAPLIRSFEPASGTWGDTITVSGDNFSNLPGTNKGYLGEVQLTTVFDSDTLLRFRIPPLPNTEQVQLSVELSGNRATTDEKFSYLLPEILGLDKSEAGYGDTVRIYVKQYNKDYLEVKFDTSSAQLVALAEESIDVTVPCSLDQGESAVVVESAGFSDQIDGFVLKTPTLKFESSYSAYYGDTIVITGENLNPDISFTSVSFGTYSAEVAEVSRSAVKFLVPETLDNPIAELTVQSGSFISDPVDFNLLLPEISSVLPQEISHPDDQIEINGRGFNTQPEYVTITLTHPNGSYVISPAEVTSMTHERIVFTLNQEQVFRYLSISVIGEISVEIRTHSFLPISDNTVIQYESTWTRKKDFPGQYRYNAVAFAINGQGYYGTGWDILLMRAYNDFWTYDPSSDTWSQIQDFPGDPRWGAVSFTINNEGYVGLGSRYFQESVEDTGHYRDFYKYSPLAGWTRIADFDGIGRNKAASFAINNLGYVTTGWWGYDDPEGLSMVTNDTWIYNPQFDQWDQTTAFPESSGIAVGFNGGDSGYVYNYNKLYLFRGDSWLQVPAEDLTESSPVGFSLGEHIYYGFGNSRGSKYNHMIEEDPFLEQWRDMQLMGQVPRSDVSVFVIDDKAYIVGGTDTQEVWEFDPSKPQI